ncbi:MAG: transposase [bacterium]|nr:transposase [bacterium]
MNRRVKLLSDNGSATSPNRSTGSSKSPASITSHRRNHPQTNGKIERLNRTAKERLNLVVYSSPAELQEALDRFRNWYNTEHYHKSIDNLHPADVYTAAPRPFSDAENGSKHKQKKTRRYVNISKSPNSLKLRNLQTQTTP